MVEGQAPTGAPSTSVQIASQAMAADLAAATSSQNQSNTQGNTLKVLDMPLNQPASIPPVEFSTSSVESTFNPFADVAKEDRIPFEKIVPENYREKEWVKNLSKTADPTAEFFKQFENAQSLIGSRQGIIVPSDDATPEQIKAYHKALGVPEDIKAYEVKPIEWAAEDKPLAENISKNRPEAFMTDLKQAAMEAGITPKQFQKALEGHDRAMLKHMKTEIAQSQQNAQTLDVEFNQLADKWFGAEKTQVLDRASKLIQSTVPPEMKAVLGRLPNESLMILAASMNGVYGKYIKEDSFKTGTGTSSPMATGMQTRKQLIELQQSEAYKNTMHPNHDDVVKRVNEGYKSLPNDALNKGLSYL